MPFLTLTSNKVEFQLTIYCTYTFKQRASLGYGIKLCSRIHRLVRLSHKNTKSCMNYFLSSRTITTLRLISMSFTVHTRYTPHADSTIFSCARPYWHRRALSKRSLGDRQLQIKSEREIDQCYPTSLWQFSNKLNLKKTVPIKYLF